MLNFILESMLCFVFCCCGSGVSSCHERTKMVIQVLILIQITEATQSFAVDPEESTVTLASTLKQGALCPGDRTATFACTAVGTDLVWLVDGRMMSYNANARVGAIRSNAQSDQTAILMRVESKGDGSGVASRMSALTISELPSARAPLTVRCHNGSTEAAQNFTFWRRPAETLNMPHVHIDLLQEGGRIHLNWTIPELNEEIHTVAHYSVQIDDALPILVKNSSAVLFSEHLDITNHSIQVVAIDSCNQQGEPRFRHFQLEATELKLPQEATHELDSSSSDVPPSSIACQQVPSLLISILPPLHVLTKHMYSG